MAQENSVKVTEYEMSLDKMGKEEGVLRYELDGLRVSSENLLNSKT